MDEQDASDGAARGDAPEAEPSPNAEPAYPVYPYAGLSVDPAAPTTPSAGAPWGAQDETDVTRPIAGRALGRPRASTYAPLVAYGADAEGNPDYAMDASYAPYPADVYSPGHSFAEWLARQAEPFSRLRTALLAAAAVVAIAVALGLGLLVSQGDWAAGARGAGVAALLMGALYLLGTVARAVLGRRAPEALLLGLAATLVFGSLGSTGLALADPLHLAQARALERSHDWAGAIREYQLAGERGPASRDVARVYLEWGDELLRLNDYDDAVSRYQTVITVYSGARTEVQRGIDGLWRAYGAWLNASTSTTPYEDILHSLDGYTRATWCDSACQTTAAALQAQASFQYGALLASAQQYSQAIVQFESVVARFPHSAYAARAHGAAATAYYALGQTQLTGTTCTDALPTYRTLSSKYGDTPEGKKAKDALAAPVSVTGVIQNAPKNPAPTVYLSSSVATPSYFSDDYSSSLDATDHFTFKQVAQGKYNLSASFGDGSGEYWYVKNSQDPYAVVVGPLCTVDIGTVTW